MTKNKRKKVKSIDNPNYLLGGLVECYCGHTKYGTFSNRHYYVCGNKQGENKCSSKHIRSEELDNTVISKLQQLDLDKFSIDTNSDTHNNFENILKNKKNKLEKLKDK